MSQITLPFRARFREAMLSGQKTCTSRTRRMGKGGDRFRAFGAEFAIVSAERRSLLWVAAMYWIDEGCTSSKDFQTTWVNIHPRRGYDPEQWVWVHWFRRVKT